MRRNVLLGSALAMTLSLAAIVSLTSGADNLTPVRWTPESVSTPDYEATPTFSPDGREMYFLSADKQFARYRILMSRCITGRWSKPVRPSFVAPVPVVEADPHYPADGKGFYFISTRNDSKAEDFDIWYVARTGHGGWKRPERLPAPVNSPEAELLPRTDMAGRLYFGSSRPGGHGQGDIYIAERDRSGRWRVGNVGPPVSTAGNEYEAEISRDGNTMIVVSDRGDRSHLYRYVRRKGRWHETGRVRADPDVFQVGPLLSPHGGKLLFAQADGERSGEMFLVDLMPGSTERWPPDCSSHAGVR